MTPTAAVLQGDAAHIPLTDASVDLVATSPPYFAMRSYTDAGEHYAGQVGAERSPTEYVDALVRATAEMARVLKPTGSIFVNLGDKYSRPGGGVDRKARSLARTGRRAVARVATPTAMFGGIPEKSLMALPWRYAIRCIDELGLILRAEIVWTKNGIPESVTDRARRNHETWLHLTKRPRYYSAAGQVVREYAGSVWHVPVQRLTLPPHLDVDHQAAFPVEWPRRLITGWCPPGGVVLDPFGGAGTTALAADVLGRRGISLDMSADYSRAAQWRIADPSERARVDVLPDEPAVLFELGSGVVA